MKLKIAHFLYYEGINISNWREHRLYNIFIQHLSLLCILRLSVCIYILEHPNDDPNEIYPFIGYDSVAFTVSTHRDQFDSFFLLSLIFFCFYTFKITRKMFLDVSNFDTIQVIHELTVIFWDNYLNSIIKSKKLINCDKNMYLMNEIVTVSRKKWFVFIPKILRKLLFRIKNWISLNSQLQFIDIDNFQKEKSYKMFKNLSNKSKFKILKILIALNKIFFAIYFLICKYFLPNK